MGNGQPRWAVLALALAALGTETFAASAGPEAGRLVVHEWGTFTSVVGPDGVPMAWRPLGGPSDLPRFVYSAPSATGVRPLKAGLAALVRMETPVVYLYADRPTLVGVDVRFPNGQVTEWYPQAARVGHGIGWPRVEVFPEADVPLPVEPDSSPYYAARRTDAAVVGVRTGDRVERERFLFYRGVGSLRLPVAVRLEGGAVRVEARERGLDHVVLFESRDGRAGHRVVRLRGGRAAALRPVLEGSADEAWGALYETLVGAGLYPREAAAMLETWRHAWFEEGLRVLYVLPPRVTDAVLPLSVSPRPDEVVRVLVARTEILVPEAGDRIARELLANGRSAEDVRAAAEALVARHGRFAEPILALLRARTRDADLRSRVDAVLRAAGTL